MGAHVIPGFSNFDGLFLGVDGGKAMSRLHDLEAGLGLDHNFSELIVDGLKKGSISASPFQSKNRKQVKAGSYVASLGSRVNGRASVVQRLGLGCQSMD